MPSISEQLKSLGPSRPPGLSKKRMTSEGDGLSEKRRRTEDLQDDTGWQEPPSEDSEEEDGNKTIPYSHSERLRSPTPPPMMPAEALRVRNAADLQSPLAGKTAKEKKKVSVHSHTM